MLAISLALATLVGFLGHLLRPTLRRDFDSGWFPISCYVVGILLGLPFVLLNEQALPASESRTTRVLIAYLLAYLGLGTGVVAGHYWKPDLE